MTTNVAIFAHNEQRRIATCLGSVPLGRPDTAFHLLVNGSSDGTARIARDWAAEHPALTVHDLNPGGKARTWNRFVHGIAGPADAWLFMDGDAQIAPGSFDALERALADHPRANAAAGIPMNGRQAAQYRATLHEERGLFGDLYALSGDFVDRIRRQAIRLPDDLVGDDGLVAALALTDLLDDSHWDLDRIIICEDAGFRAEQVSLLSPATWTMQRKRMVNYSVRHFQNRIVSDIMGRAGPAGLPQRLAGLYPDWWGRFVVRGGVTGWFDRAALRRMRRANLFP